MYVTYFDEVKANPDRGQHSYVVGGISVLMERIPALEAQVNTLSQEVFNSTELIQATEFHGSFIYFAKGPFKGMDPGMRIGVLGRLAAILSAETVNRVYAAIDTTKLRAAHKAAEFAFAHFCERVQMLIPHNSVSLLIGDLDDEQARNMIRDFALYRATRTPWAYGMEITRIADSVHFARSHHSRMVQLADVYLFLVMHNWGSRKGKMAEALTAALKDTNLWPHRYKHWPNG